MNARCLALLALLGAAGCSRVTEVVVQVDSNGLAIPAQIDRMRIVVSNPSMGDLSSGNTSYETPLITLCGAAPQPGCQSLPISLTLVPGPSDASALVRVEVQSFAPGQQTPATTDASVFSFVSGTRQQLRFVLRETCLGMDCAAQNAVCGTGGVCTVVTPTDPRSPDMAVSASIERVAFASGSVDTLGGGASTMSVAVSVPAVQAGDLMIAAVDASSMYSTTAPNFVSPLPPPWIMLNTDTQLLETFAIAYAIAKGTPDETNLLLGVTPSQAQVGTAHWLFAAYRGAAGIDMPYLVQTQNSPSSYTFPAQPIPAGGGYLALASNAGAACTAITAADAQLQIAGPWTLITALSTNGEEGANAVMCEDGATPGALQTSLELVISPLD